METLELRNIRSLVNTGPIRIAPITILVGQNSSGKSTFARFFPLLKQGAEARTREPLLWLGRLVDFGSTEEARSRFASDTKLGFAITAEIPSGALDGRRRAWAPNAPGPESETLKIEVNYNLSSASRRYEYSFKFRDNILELGLDEDGRLVSFQVNGSDRTDLITTNRLVANWVGPIPNLEAIDSESLAGKSAYTELLKFVRQNLDGRTGIERAQRLTRTLTIGPVESLYNRALTATAGDEYWRRQVRNWGANSQKMKLMAELVLAFQFFSESISSIALHLRRTFINIRYITPLRASAERYYRLQGLSIEEIDPQGQNIAMFLHNLSHQEKESFETWMTS